MMQAVVSTLQDLGFVIDRADYTIGTITATKLDGYHLVMTVTVRPQGKKRMLVRANARWEETLVKDPQPYQDFFNTLRRSLFIQNQNF